jgi:hypothetical protein
VVLFKNKANEVRVLAATTGATALRNWTFPYQLDQAQARLLTKQGVLAPIEPRPRPDPAIDLASPSKRQRAGLQSPRARRARPRTAERLLNVNDTVSYEGTITAAQASSVCVIPFGGKHLYS